MLFIIPVLFLIGWGAYNNHFFFFCNQIRIVHNLDFSES